jgi:hypothetical protein
VNISDDDLLYRYEITQRQLKTMQDTLGRLEQEIFHRMEERGSVGIPSDDYTCELKTTNSYDYERLASLKEILNATDLGTCWTPSYQKVVVEPEKWDIRKLVPVAKRYGDRAVGVVEQARSVSSRRLKFEVKGNGD